MSLGQSGQIMSRKGTSSECYYKLYVFLCIVPEVSRNKSDVAAAQRTRALKREFQVKDVNWLSI